MKIPPHKIIRSVIDTCTDCDVCRFLMDSSCSVFPEIYRLWDIEAETGEKIRPADLKRLVELCNFCALCPCPNIRADILKAKTGFIQESGLKPEIRIVEDVALLNKICGCLPQLTNFLFRNSTIAGHLKQLMGIHPERKLPEFPKRDFPSWARKNNVHLQPKTGSELKVAYFAGCTVNYMFPEVGKAVVSLLQANGVDVWHPPQLCCGMPTYLEGDREKTLKFARSNLSRLGEAVDEGYDIICSCPTCGFMLKNILAEGAYYSREYQEAAGDDEDSIVVPGQPASGDRGQGDLVQLKKTIYQDLLKDDGYFSCLPPLKRIAVAEHTMDLGQYLNKLDRLRALSLDPTGTSGLMVYFAPCHQREQQMGQPYPALLQRIPGLDLDVIDGNFYCCGMAGIMGFKPDFHEESIALGQPLMEKIRKFSPDGIVTECLSCKLQFMQLTPYPVYHPAELLQPAEAGFQQL